MEIYSTLIGAAYKKKYAIPDGYYYCGFLSPVNKGVTEIDERFGWRIRIIS